MVNCVPLPLIKVPTCLKSICIVFMLSATALFPFKSTYGQMVLVTESFDVAGPYPQSNLPFGWIQNPHCFDAATNPLGGATCTDTDNYWDIVGVNSQIGTPATPTCSPKTGAGMLRYRSAYVNAGEKAIVVSRKLDMTRNGTFGTCAGSVYIYREDVTTNLDSINIYANVTPNMSGSPQRITGAISNIPRYCGAVPATPCLAPYNAAGWYQVNFTVPNTGIFFNSNSVYIIIAGISRGTANSRNIFIDDFSCQTYPNVEQLFVNDAAVVNQNTNTTAPGLTKQQIIGLQINVTGQGPSATVGVGIKDIIFNTNGSTNPITDIINAKLWFTGGTNDFDTVTAQLLDTYVNPHSTNFSMLATAFSGLQNGTNYFWLTYDLNSNANLGNYVDAEVVSFSTVKGIAPWTITTGRVTTPATLTGSRLINISYCGANNLFSWPSKRDYIAKVLLLDRVTPTSGIDNIYNTFGPSACMPFCRYTTTPPAYDLFPPTVGRTASLSPDSNYTLSVTVGPGGGLLGILGFTGASIVSAWIDYDKSGTFTAAENLGTSGLLGNGVTASFNFHVPLTALAGNVRLRVRTSWLFIPGPCGAGLFGETEDYMVAIVPPCAPLWPGWKTWLGFTNDWDNPANWCGGIPTPNDNARIPGPGGPNGRPGSFSPKIKPGVIATAKNLRIESNDTIFVDAAKNASLTVDSTLLLLNSTSALIVNSTFQDSARLSNGLLNGLPLITNINEPIKNNISKTRNIWLYNQSELLSEGIQAGDIITNILMHINHQSTNFAPLRGLTIKVYYTNAGSPGFIFNGTGDLPPVVSSAPVTIFGPQDVDITSFIPIGSYGTVDLTLIPGAFVWDGSANKLVIDMCYDNYMSTMPNQIERFSFTQTVGLKHFLSITNTKDNANYPACSMAPPHTVDAAGVVTGTVGANVINVTAPTVNRIAVGQWVQGNGFNVGPVGVAIAHAANSTIITMDSVTGILPGHYVNQGNGPMVLNVIGNQLFLAASLTSTLLATSTLTFRPAIVSIVGTTVTLSTTGGGVVGPISATIGFGNTNSSGGTGFDYRPNLTFKFSRPYETFPITVKRDWVNNGFFIPGESKVTFSSSLWGGGQQISGSNITTFYDMAINDTDHVVMNLDAKVTDTIFFNAGHLKVNNNLLTLTNNNSGAVQRTGGGLQTDADVLGAAVSPFSRFRWDMGSATGNREIPFINIVGDYIPLTYNVTAGIHDVTFTSYGTPADNQNIPLPIVTSILGQTSPGNWGTNGNGMVDRYYMIDNIAGSGGPSADITFRYANSERAGYGNTNMRAQRWISATSQWELPLLPGQAHTVGSPDEVSLTNFDQFSTPHWWTIVGQTTPLPVKLLDFTATQFKDKVRLNWTTASEINSSHFIVERSVNNLDFSFIGRVESKGPSSNNIDYQTWDLNPVEGIQYYYLRQYDHDGRSESFGPVSAKFSNQLFEIVTAIVESNEMGLTVMFNYDSNKPYSYRIIDMAGRIIAAKDRNPGEPGLNSIEIDTKLAKGIYQVILHNDDKVVSRKFFN